MISETLRGAALAAGALAASQSHASMLGHRWVEVDNGSLTIGSGPSRTFDLFITTDTAITLLDSGVTQSSGANPGLALDTGDFFQQDFFGSDNDLPPTAPQIGAEPGLEFDTYVGLGTVAAADTLVLSAIDFSGGVVAGTWSIRGGDPAAQPDDDGQVFFGRFTVPSDAPFTNESASRSLAGTVFVFPLGASAGEVLEISNPYALPTPGAATMLFLVGVSLARRRRAGATPIG